MSWVVAPNPAYEGRTPTPLVAECHDRTPFLSISCPDCAGAIHIHESQIEGIPSDAVMALRCPLCKAVSDACGAMFVDAFAWCGSEGWIADA